MEDPGLRSAGVREFGQVAVYFDRRAARYAGLQPVAQVDAQLFADAGRQIADDARDLRALEVGFEVERAAPMAWVAVIGGGGGVSVRVRDAEVGQLDGEGRVILAGRFRRDGPVCPAVQTVEFQARVVEHARQRNRDIRRVERGGAMVFVGVDTAPQVFDTGNARARVIQRGEPRRRFLRGEADALQVALETIALDRLGAARPVVAARFAGFAVCRVPFRSHSSPPCPRGLKRTRLFSRRRGKRQRAAEFGEDAQVDTVAADADELPMLQRGRPVSGRSAWIAQGCG